MEEMFTLIGNYGFPMAVAGYLLVRLEPLIRELQKSVALLTVVVARQADVDLEEARVIVEGGSGR
ncbi:MAG: YvrJ family protein [Bacillota bacterium]